MDPKKKNLILGVAAVVILGIALVIGFRDSLFGGTTTSKEVQAIIEESNKQPPEPPPPAPAAPVFSKKASKVGG